MMFVYHPCSQRRRPPVRSLLPSENSCWVDIINTKWTKKCPGHSILFQYYCNLWVVFDKSPIKVIYHCFTFHKLLTCAWPCEHLQGRQSRRSVLTKPALGNWSIDEPLSLYIIDLYIRLRLFYLHSSLSEPMEESDSICRWTQYNI